MIISLRLKNFYSIKEEAVLDFTADTSVRKNHTTLHENLIEKGDDKFVNIIGLFGSNAAGKSNMIKAIDFCRNLVISSHLSNEGDAFDFKPFKFGNDTLSEFVINFITMGKEYEYSFAISNDVIVKEALYHFPANRKARIFERTNISEYKYGKGLIHRPREVEINTGNRTLFLSRASSMNRPIAQDVYRFFLNEIIVGIPTIDYSTINREEFERYRPIILKALEISDSDIIDIRLLDNGNQKIRLESYHKENPEIPFEFEREESDGTKRLFAILITLLRKTISKTSIFIDEFDLKLHLRLAEFILDLVRASQGAQLVFTSHNPMLINPSLLRREQIVFVNKSINGNSEFTSLSEYTGLKASTDIQKAYLQGRFDAVPYVGNVYNILHELLK